MRVFYCVRDLSQIHSCMYNMFLIRDLGYEVIPILGSTTKDLNELLKNHNINVTYYSLKKNIPHWKYFLSINYNFLKEMRKGLKEYNKDDLVIVGTADSALYSFPIFIKKRFIVCLLEMHENQKFLQKVLKYICAKAQSVVCCEVNRARYAQFKWNLKRRPYVISNKPYSFYQPTEDLCEKSKKVITQINGRKAVLYQAWHIHQTDVITSLLKALTLLNENIVLVIMGIVDSCVDKKALEAIYPNIIWAGHIAAPRHLEVTKNIDIGVAMYSETSLNNMFCAPNKTFEYSSFGKPVLCNDIPGLVETIGINNAGVCVNWSDCSMIASGIKQILSDYEFYSNKAKEFYERENNLEAMNTIVKNL